MKKCARLTKRLQREYFRILNGTAGVSFYPHPYAYAWGNRAKNISAWQAYLFAKEWRSRVGVDLRRLENMVARGTDPECAYRFARDVPGANVKQLQRTVVRCGDPDAIRRFSLLSGADKPFLERLLIVAEVMAT